MATASLPGADGEFLDVPDATMSLVIEWANVATAGAAQARRALCGLADEVRSLGRPIEVLLMHDPNGSDVAAADLLAELPPDAWGPSTVTLVDSEELDYYELKNAGATRSSGDLIVFADSDALPEPGWFKEITHPFVDPAVQVVAGATFVEPTRGIVDKHFALNWLFATRPEDTGHAPSSRFNANNVAFRRPTFAARPFPYDDRFRGRCHALARTLIAENTVIVKNPRARMAHARPRGARAILNRAVCTGHDRVTNDRMRGESHLVRRVFQRFHKQLRRSVRRTVSSYRLVDARRWQVPFLIGFAAIYAAATLAGGLLTIAAPQFVRRHFAM
jgi:hypothetical protein